jgi:hypothetical protein
MTPDLLFSLSGSVALAGWLSLAAGILFRNALLRDTVAGIAIPLALSAAYTALILVFWWTAEGGFDSLASVQKLFTAPWVALAGWVHYLAFDLAIGAYLARRIMAAGLPRLLLIPVLPLTFLFGPIGFLLGQALLLGRKEA